MTVKKDRTLKVYETSGYKYQQTPTIMLRGKWLEQFGFAIGDRLTVHCEKGTLVVMKDTTDSEMAHALKEKNHGK